MAGPIVPTAAPGSDFHRTVTLPAKQLLTDGGSIVIGSGVQIVVVDAGTNELPLAGSVSTDWVAPGAEIPEATVGSTRVPINIKGLKSYTELSNESVSDDAILDSVRYQMGRALAYAVDAACLAPVKATGGPDSWLESGNWTPVDVEADPYGGLADAAATIQAAAGIADVLFAGPQAYANLRKVASASGGPFLTDPATGEVRVLGMKISPCNALDSTQLLAADGRALGLALRADVTIDVDGSIAFRRDSTALRGTARVCPIVLDPSGVVLLETDVA